jgi:hypothetical protein
MNPSILAAIRCSLMFLVPSVTYAISAPVITYTDEINPGPAGTGIVINPHSPPHFYSVENWQSSLNGTGFNGQTVRLDLLFNGFFVRAYTQTEKLHSFLVDMFLPYLPFWNGVHPPLDSPSVSGTATLLNAVGQPIGSPNVLNEALDGGPTVQPDVQLSFYPDFSVTPVDIYGIQYDLELSDSPGKYFSNAPRSDSMFFAGFFGVGPGKIPADIVPDHGSTFLLLTLGLLGLVTYRRQLLRGHP